jgi:hypothetical protein
MARQTPAHAFEEDLVNERVFAALSRRASLLTLGAARSAAELKPATADAKNKNRNSKVKKKAKQKCEQQVGPCNDFVITQCDAADEACISRRLACCAFLGACDVTGLLTCLDERQES